MTACCKSRLGRAFSSIWAKRKYHLQDRWLGQRWVQFLIGSTGANQQTLTISRR